VAVGVRLDAEVTQEARREKRLKDRDIRKAA